MNAAFVVGCSSYEDADIADLKYAHRDAIGFADLLKDTCGLRDDEIMLIHDEHPDPRHLPTRANILRQISRGAEVTKSASIEMLFFFFSGHGFRSTGTQADYLLTQDAFTTALEDSSLPFDMILRRLREWEPQHVLLFLDACRASTSGGKAVLSDELPNVDVASLCPSGMVSFCSCEPGRSSYESDDLQAGIFTAGIREALSDRGKCNTIYELDTYLARIVPELSRRYDRPVQRPHTRVEPLGVQRLELVSPRKRNEWRAAMPIGGEIRRARVPVHAGTGERERLMCAIDLGTSYSVASIFEDHGDRGEPRLVHLIPSPEGQRLVPSVLNFDQELNYLVGTPAVEADRYRPESTIRHVKRALGTSESYEIQGRSLDPEFAASLILRSLKKNAEEYLGERVERCIASYPANFSIAQTNALLRAFELADLDIVRMVGEPNVASHLLLSQNGPDFEGRCLVIDLGGGTFDVAIVDAGQQVAELVGVAGSNQIGGLDYDEALAAYIEQQLREQTAEIQLTVALQRQIRREAERAKRALGSQERTSVLLQDLELDSGGLRDVEVPVDRDLFRGLTAELNRQVERTIEQALESWRERRGRGKDDIDVVLLAGQGSKIFTVKEALERFELAVPVMTDFQETAVVHGLAYQAGVLQGQLRDVLLIDVVHRDIGFRCHTAGTAGENPSVARDPAQNREIVTLVQRSVTMPTLRSERATVEGAGSSPVTLEIVHPASAYLEREELIASVQFPVQGIDTELELTFEIDGNNTVQLTIVDPSHKWVRHYQLNNHYLDPPPPNMRDRLEMLLDGYTIWPDRRSTDLEVDDEPLTLDRLDFVAELTDLDERMRQYREELSRREDLEDLPSWIRESLLEDLQLFASQRDRLLQVRHRISGIGPSP